MRCSFGRVTINESVAPGVAWGDLLQFASRSMRNPHGALAVEWLSVVRDSALYGQATVETTCEGPVGAAQGDVFQEGCEMGTVLVDSRPHPCTSWAWHSFKG